jgi:hypothetical protein
MPVASIGRPSSVISNHASCPNTVLGILKTTLAGARHAFAYGKYAAHLAAFADRFNRRFDLHTLVVPLIVAAARCKPPSEQVSDGMHSDGRIELRDASVDRRVEDTLVSRKCRS